MTSVAGSISKYVFYFKKTMFPKKAFSNMFICVGQMKATWHTSLSAVVSHTVFDIILLSCVWGEKRHVTQVTTLLYFYFGTILPSTFSTLFFLGIGLSQGLS